MLRPWVSAYSHWVFRRRWIIIIACFLAVSAAALGLRQLEFTAGIRSFFGQKNPELIAWNALENTYTKTDSILFVLKPDSGDLFTPETLRVIYNLTEVPQEFL